MSVQLFIRYLTRTKTITVDVKLTDTILMVKQQIEKQTGDKASFIHLLYGGTRLDNERTLTSYNIIKESTLKLDWDFVAIETDRIKRVYKHEPNVNNCPLMINSKKKGDDDTDSKEEEFGGVCQVYEDLKQYKFCLKHLQHMQTYNHCDLKYVLCRYGDSCKAYKRLENGGNRLDDQCHLHTFLHPPRVRKRSLFLPKGFNPFVFDSKTNVGLLNNLAKMKRIMDNRYENKDDELLEALMNEVKKNGFGNDLMLTNGASLLTIVDEKLKHKRHTDMGSPLNKALMLSIVLYTGCDCNYDLCSSQRNGDYKKWAVFDYCLKKAIKTLAENEYGKYAVYTGVGNAMIDFKKLQANKVGGVYSINGWLSTFTSTSWDKKVAQQFCGPNGMIMGLESKYRKYGCDVSWISKFPNEKEVLFASFDCYFPFRNVGQNKNMQYVIAGGDNEKLF